MASIVYAGPVAGVSRSVQGTFCRPLTSSTTSAYEHKAVRLSMRFAKSRARVDAVG